MCDLIWYTILFCSHTHSLLLRIYKLNSIFWQMTNEKQQILLKIVNFSLSLCLCLSGSYFAHKGNCFCILQFVCVHNEAKRVSGKGKILLQMNETKLFCRIWTTKFVDFYRKIDKERKENARERNDLTKEKVHTYDLDFAHTMHTIKSNWKIKYVSFDITISLSFCTEIHSVTSITNYTPVCTQFFFFFLCAAAVR